MIGNLFLLTVVLFNVQSTPTSYVFEEKFVNSGDNLTFSVAKQVDNEVEFLTNANDLVIGTSYENNGTAYYASVLKIPLRGYKELELSSASLTMYKKQGYGTSFNVKMTTSSSFQLGVTDPFSDFMFHDSAYINLTGNYFTINVKNWIEEYSNRNKEYMYLIFSSSSSSVTVFGDSSNGYLAKLNVRTTTLPTLTGTGSASEYKSINPGGGDGMLCNCFGYAFENYLYYDGGVFNDLFTSVTNDNLDDVTNALISELYARFGIKARIIDDYNSQIYPFEYRVAFRFRLNSTSYHFMRQTDTSSWAYVLSTSSGSYQTAQGINPANIVWDINNNYNSNIVYLGVWRTK